MSARPDPLLELVAADDAHLVGGFVDYLRNGPYPYTEDTIRTYVGQLTTYVRMQVGDSRPRLSAVISRSCLTSTLLRVPRERVSARRNLLFAVKACASYLRDVDVIDGATHAAIAEMKFLARHTPSRPHLSEEQVKTVIRAILADPDYDNYERLLNLAVFSMLVVTGLRNSEACNLRLADVDFESGVITIVRGKGNKRRVVGLPDRLVPTLRLYLCHRPTAADDRFFIGPRGNPLNRDLLIKRFRRMSKKLGFDVGAHRLRRTFATSRAHAGVPLDKLQVILGHADIKTTRDYVQTQTALVATEMRAW